MTVIKKLFISKYPVHGPSVLGEEFNDEDDPDKGNSSGQNEKDAN